MKRRCNSSMEEGNHVINIASSSLSNDHILITERATEEYVTDAFMKLLMCHNISSVNFDVIMKDPYVRMFLERAHKYGVPSSLLHGDSLVIEKSLVNIKHDLLKYMEEVKAAWKTMGCTLMMFNVDEKKGINIFANEKDKYVFGFYCPKGIIFVEAPSRASGTQDDLKHHSPSLELYDATHLICHSSDDHHLLCELSDEMITSWTSWPFTFCGYEFAHMSQLSCLRHEIQWICSRVCEDSEWAQNLIKKADEIREHVLTFPRAWDWYCKNLKEKGLREAEDATHESRLSNFMSIILLEKDLKKHLSYFLRYEGIWKRPQLEALLDDSNFWDEGWKLKMILTYILKIPNILDTLVPTSGYLAMAIDKAKHVLFAYYGRTSQEGLFKLFLQDLDSKLRRNIGGSNNLAASYLNPAYFLQQEDTEKNLKIPEEVMEALKEIVSEEEWEQLDEQLQRYGDVFKNLSAGIQLESYHPVKLWEQYGHGLPLLQEYAIKLLSQPSNCMCNQVKKHMVHLKGADDYILRLNVRMMEEFRNLGADIYKPFDLSELDKL